MLVFSCKCGDETATTLVIRGSSFECGDPQPDDDDMIAPLLAEAYPPEGAVIVGKMVFLTHAPVLMTLNGGIRLSSAFPGSGTMSVDIYADGQKIFDAPIEMGHQWKAIPKAGIKETWRTIQPGTRLDIQVAALSEPSGYPTWKGLQAIFLPVAVEDPS